MRYRAIGRCRAGDQLVVYGDPQFIEQVVGSGTPAADLTEERALWRTRIR